MFSSEVCSVAADAERSDADMTFSGEVVVFDDIDDSWCDEEPRMEANTDDMFSTTESDQVAKVIGNLPIAVYDGSPRRYGVRHVENNCTHPQLPSAQSLLASPSVYPPRPGFPQRIVCSPNEGEANTNTENGSFNVSQEIT